jgi:hypothetical protein
MKSHPENDDRYIYIIFAISYTTYRGLLSTLRRTPPSHQPEYSSVRTHEQYHLQCLTHVQFLLSRPVLAKKHYIHY